MSSEPESSINESASPAFAICVAALIGSFIGGVWMPTWHVPVESAQVVSGLIEYPNDNPFYYYHLKSWTVLHQICAVFLKVGFSEKTLSVLISACLGASLFGSLSWLCWIICRRTIWAIIAPMAMFYLLGRGIEYGVAYPIFIFGSHHTYGTVGRIYVLLTFLFLVTGHRRIGWTMLGFAPAIHITWGAFAWAMGLGTALWEKWYTKENLKGIVPWFLLGIVCVLIPYQLILMQASELPVVPAEVQSEHLQAFLTHWDFHRQPTPLMDVGIALALMLFSANCWVLFKYSYCLDDQSKLLLKVFIVAGFGGLIGCFAAHYPHFLPNVINMGMPGRFINLTIMVYSVVLLGLWVRLSEEIPAAKWMVLLNMVYIIWNQFFLSILSSNRFGWKLDHWKFWLVLGSLIFLIPLVKKIPVHVRGKWIIRSVQIASVIMIVMFGDGFMTDWKKEIFILNKPTNPVYEAARAGEGMLITSGSMQLVQLETGRPVMINTGGLDQISPMPATAPAIAEILDTVYGVDFFDPPDDIRGTATLLNHTGLDTWEARSREEWREIAKKYGATQILMVSLVELDLEIEEEKGTLILYNLPQ